MSDHDDYLDALRSPFSDATKKAMDLMYSQMMKDALLYGTGISRPYGTLTGRMPGKSMFNFNPMPVRGKWGSVAAGSPDMAWFDDYAFIEASPVHVFPHKGNYMEVNAHAKLPKRCIYMQDRQWYQRTKGAGGLQLLEPSQVPKALRLQLKLMQVDQPEW